MKTDLKTAFVLCFFGAAGVVWFVPRFPMQTAQAGDRVATDVAARVRPLGLNVVGQPARQGEVYVVEAQDIRGADMRVLVDARTGGVVSIGPSPSAGNFAYSPHYDASPRIITIAPTDDYVDAPAPRSADGRRVRQVVPSRERPRDVYPRIEATAPLPEPAPRRETTQQAKLPAKPEIKSAKLDAMRDQEERERQRYETIKREEIRRAVEEELRARLAARPATKSAPVPATSAAPPSPVTAAPVTAAPVPEPRVRPRTVLAPPPYADPDAATGSSTPKSSPSLKPTEEEAAPPPEDTSRSEVHAAVPQGLPPIPAPPRPVAAPKAEDVQIIETKSERPEDLPPPGTAVGDFNASAR